MLGEIYPVAARVFGSYPEFLPCRQRLGNRHDMLAEAAPLTAAHARPTSGVW